MTMTGHAQKRSQQRAIPPILIDLLRQFGTTEKAAGGVNKVFFDKAARRRVHAYAGVLGSVLDQYLRVYAVISNDDEVITVGYLLERVRRQ